MSKISLLTLVNKIINTEKPQIFHQVFKKLQNKSSKTITERKLAPYPIVVSGIPQLTAMSRVRQIQ